MKIAELVSLSGGLLMQPTQGIAQTPLDSKMEAIADCVISLAHEIVATIRECPDGMPSGHLYVAMMSKGMSLNQYNAFIGVLKEQGFLTETNHVLRAVK